MYEKYPCARRSIWLQTDFERLRSVTLFSEMVQIATGIISRFDEPVTIVSGPMSTGGEGSRERNYTAFIKTIKFLQSQNVPVFDQSPFETVIVRLALEWSKNHEGYCIPILEKFYEPVFRCGGIDTVAFMHNWSTSYGSKWERNLALSIPLKIKDLHPPTK